MKPSIQNINSIKNLNKIDSTAILILQNGKFFKGLGLGYQGTATGEVCFNTSITFNWSYFQKNKRKNSWKVCRLQ